MASQIITVLMVPETIVVVNVRDKTESPIAGIEVVLTSTMGIVAPSSGVSDATGQVRFVVAHAGGTVTATAAVAPFEAATASVPVEYGEVMALLLTLETKYELKHRYLWQNAVVRPHVYPAREEMLRAFLTLYKGIDLQIPANIPSDAADVAAALIAQKEGELVQAKADLKLAKPKSTQFYTARERVVVLERQIALLKGPDAPRQATKITYAEKVVGMNHKALVTEVLNRFDADATFALHEKWVRYMVLHYSGLRYESAHGTFGSPKKLVPMLVGEELLDILLNRNQTSTARLIELAREAHARVMADTLGVYKGKKGPYKVGPDPGEMDVGAQARLDKPANIQARKVVCQSVAYFFELTAQTICKSLGDMELLAVLQARSPSSPLVRRRMPALAWKAVVHYTLLRNDVASMDELFDDIPPPKYDKDKQGAYPKKSDAYRISTSQNGFERATKRWMDNKTGSYYLWRPYHQEHLEPIVTHAVCNELDEMSLHVRNLRPNGGITQNANWIAPLSKSQKLRPFKSLNDVTVGGSLFFAKWAEKSTPDTYLDIRTPMEGGIPIADGTVVAQPLEVPTQWGEEGSTYFTRIVDGCHELCHRDAKGVKVLVWHHEASIVRKEADRVVTHETGGTGLHDRKPDWSIYTGEVDKPTVHSPKLDPFLERKIAETQCDP